MIFVYNVKKRGMLYDLCDFFLFDVIIAEGANYFRRRKGSISSLLQVRLQESGRNLLCVWTRFYIRQMKYG